MNSYSKKFPKSIFKTFYRSRQFFYSTDHSSTNLNVAEDYFFRANKQWKFERKLVNLPFDLPFHHILILSSNICLKCSLLNWIKYRKVFFSSNFKAYTYTIWTQNVTTVFRCFKTFRFITNCFALPLLVLVIETWNGNLLWLKMYSSRNTFWGNLVSFKQ